MKLLAALKTCFLVVAAMAAVLEAGRIKPKKLQGKILAIVAPKSKSLIGGKNTKPALPQSGGVLFLPPAPAYIDRSSSAFGSPFSSSQHQSLYQVQPLTSQQSSVPYILVGGAMLSSPFIQCEDVRYYVPAHEKDMYKCCGRNVFYFPTQYCSRDGLINVPPENAARIVCNGVQYFVAESFRSFYGCCDSQLYDIEASYCDPLLAMQTPPGELPPPYSIRPPETPTYYPPPPLTPSSPPYNPPAYEPPSYSPPTYPPPPYNPPADNIPEYTPPSDLPPPFDPPPSYIPPTYSPSASLCEKGYLCCKNFPPVENPSNILKCCGDIGPYDPNVIACTLN